MKFLKFWHKIFICALLLGIAFFAGWKTNSLFVVGEEAMGTFMSEISALAYLQKGDSQNAILMLRDSAERNLTLAHRHGTYILESQHPGATNRWILTYAELRKKLPPPISLSKEANEFDREVETIITEARNSGKLANQNR